MKKIFFGIASIILIFSCNIGNNKSRNQNDTKSQKIKIIEQSKIELNINEKKPETKNGNYESKMIKEHAFSIQDKKDTFKLLYNFENLEDSMIFQITDYSGVLIFEKRFLGISFYDYGRPSYEYITDPQRGKDFDPNKLSIQISDSLHKADLQFIRKRMNEFFGDDNFMVNPVMKLNKDMLNVSDYKEITGDSTVIGFSYKLFEGGGFEMIAYSKMTQKVRLIASSD